MAEQQVLKYKGTKPTPQMIVGLWMNAEKRFGGTEGRTDRIKKSQEFRRGTDRIRLDATFLRNNPEIDPERVVSILSERTGYETDLIARAGAIEPEISRQPLDVTDKADDDAEAYENYMREVASEEEHGIPFQGFIEKATEDGEYGTVSLPWDLDAEGYPDFYDRLTERALANLKAEERKEYTKDEIRRGRYVKRDAQGNLLPNPKYDRDTKGRDRARAEKEDGKGKFKRDRGKSKDAHEAAVRRYLLGHSATTHRVIPALDCYPLLGRGHGRQKWSVEGLIERALFDKEDIVDKRLGWAMLGSRLILPKGSPRPYSGASDTTTNGFYLYTAYLMLEDEDGVKHPTILYTVGGASTWWEGGVPDNMATSSEVAIIDLYAERKITRRLWDYQFGTHSSDDDPNYYGQPAIWRHRKVILNIEALRTANHIMVEKNAYTGYIYRADAALAAVDPEALIEPGTHTLRRPKIPGAGAIEPAAGEILPFKAAMIGPDAWRLEADYMASLKEAMAVDEVRGDTGNAMLVSSKQGQEAKRQIREAGIRSYKFCLEADAMIRLGAYKCHEVKWPILSSEELPVGHEMRPRQSVTEFNPDWLGEDENPRLLVTYGEEFNLARADLEMNAADRGYRALKHVAAAFGEPDEMNLRVAIEKDRMWKLPQNEMLLQMMIDQERGMTRQRQAQLEKLQGNMTEQGVPGADTGLPTDMLKRAGEQMAQGGAPGGAPPGGGGGRPPYAASIRGGIQSGAVQADAAALNAGAA